MFQVCAAEWRSAACSKTRPFLVRRLMLAPERQKLSGSVRSIAGASVGSRGSATSSCLNVSLYRFHESAILDR